MPNYEQEHWCLDRLKSAILSDDPSAVLREKKGCEPPDFWLDVDDRQFAIEITTIRVERDQTLWQSLCDLVKEIEASAAGAGLLSGRYFVYACAELPAGKKFRDELTEKILAYLRDTRGTTTSIARELYINGALFCEVTKYAGDKAELHLTGSLTNTGGFEGEVSNELRQLLDQRITRKRKKLVGCQYPAVLVLYDCYFRELAPEKFAQHIKASAATPFFYAIFLIHATGPEIFAHQRGSLVK